MSGQFYLFSTHLISDKKKFKISYGYILAKCGQQRQQMHPQWGPNTHYDSLETPFCAEKPFCKLLKASQYLI